MFRKNRVVIPQPTLYNKSIRQKPGTNIPQGKETPMKKFIALLLSILTVLSLFGCGPAVPADTSAPETAAPQETEVPPEPSEPKDYSAFAGIVEDPKAWYEKFMALPIANADMTEEELRKLCVDAFEMNLTFQWTPNQPISYTYELLDKYYDVNLPTGNAYAGLCYATGIAKATFGTIWKILPYYDVETGVLDTAAMGEAVLNYLSSACALGATQGWNRISNNHGVGDMKNFNMYDSNILPVGPYTYTPEDYDGRFGGRVASTKIIAKNGEEVMYESYAQMKIADGVYSSSSYHVMMCSVAPVVVRDENGKIDPEQSYLYVHEQGGANTKSDKNNILQDNGYEMRPLGTVYNKYTFKKLLEKGYIPFTFKEFTGEEPVEPGQAWIGTAEKPLENGTAISPSSLCTKTLYTNYSLCVVEAEVRNPAGERLSRFSLTLLTTADAYETMLTDPQLANRIKPYANGKNTVHIYARLANGELIEAFQGILKG